MSSIRLIAIIFIFGVISLAWMVLGGTVFVRTEDLGQTVDAEMQSQWGPKVVAQSAPFWSLDPKGRDSYSMAVPSSSSIYVKLSHENRDKGLLWFSTFTAGFSGTYVILAESEIETGKKQGFFHFELPADTTPRDLTVSLDNKPIQLPYEQKVSGSIHIPMDRSADHTISITFKTNGQNMWLYYPGKAGQYPSSREYETPDNSAVQGQTTSELQNFTLNVETDFRAIDYPRGSQSPNNKAIPNNNGMKVEWQFQNLITRQPMGIVMPIRANAGPIVARMSFFAPVSLFFFFTVMFVVCVLKKIPLHPMHFLFLSAGFFAFHILLAYLADHVSIHLAFWICAGISVLLVVSYLRLVAGVKFAVFYAGIAQLMYLVGFSYAFFWVGMTGLTITIGAVATLFVLMQTTGRVNWAEVFGKKAVTSLTSPPPLSHTQPVVGSDDKKDDWEIVDPTQYDKPE